MMHCFLKRKIRVRKKGLVSVGLAVYFRLSDRFLVWLQGGLRDYSAEREKGFFFFFFFPFFSFLSGGYNRDSYKICGYVKMQG